MLLLLLTAMPPVWSDGVELKLYRYGRDYVAKPGLRKENGERTGQKKLSRDKDMRLRQFCKWLDNREPLPADLLAALQESAPNASSSEVGTPAEHTPEVRAELIEPLACTA